MIFYKLNLSPFPSYSTEKFKTNYTPSLSPIEGIPVEFCGHTYQAKSGTFSYILLSVLRKLFDPSCRHFVTIHQRYRRQPDRQHKCDRRMTSTTFAVVPVNMSKHQLWCYVIKALKLLAVYPLNQPPHHDNVIAELQPASARTAQKHHTNCSAPWRMSLK